MKPPASPWLVAALALVLAALVAETYAKNQTYLGMKSLADRAQDRPVDPAAAETAHRHARASGVGTMIGLAAAAAGFGCLARATYRRERGPLWLPLLLLALYVQWVMMLV